MTAGGVIARNVRRFRSERGMSMSELGSRSGLAKQTIVSIESGSGNPTIDTVERIAATLGVSMRALLTELGSDVLLDQGESATWRRNNRVRVRHLDQSFGSGYVTNSIVRVEASRGRAVYSPVGRGSLRHAYVLEGELRIGPTSAPVVAVAGDFVRFPADVEHLLEAITAVAVFFSCTTSPQVSMGENEAWF
ncbi:DNA-binding transcriptional regulator, XRE-family HTH domain [Microbacterium azadirachtae]|uniref:DNA-binding transcriptional regulator, XRE-family HTH domain n=1 Tax=Microbacterium azadirachtae TaxID=582680 RepID=A0A1I6FUE5_9MICO|nr:XRE family transcriptional regulator [Microbacterium azadirachtae]SFR33544.1 DNA-binding transcriptional regulator, XRE-family HTH domain [Microbacterium azadirachtae]